MGLYTSGSRLSQDEVDAYKAYYQEIAAAKIAENDAMTATCVNMGTQLVSQLLSLTLSGRGSSEASESDTGSSAKISRRVRKALEKVGAKSVEDFNNRVYPDADAKYTKAKDQALTTKQTAITSAKSTYNTTTSNINSEIQEAEGQLASFNSPGFSNTDTNNEFGSVSQQKEELEKTIKELKQRLEAAKQEENKAIQNAETEYNNTVQAAEEAFKPYKEAAALIGAPSTDNSLETAYNAEAQTTALSKFNKAFQTFSNSQDGSDEKISAAENIKEIYEANPSNSTIQKQSEIYNRAATYFKKHRES